MHDAAHCLLKLRWLSGAAQPDVLVQRSVDLKVGQHHDQRKERIFPQGYPVLPVNWA